MYGVVSLLLQAVFTGNFLSLSGNLFPTTAVLCRETAAGIGGHYYVRCRLHSINAITRNWGCQANVLQHGLTDVLQCGIIDVLQCNAADVLQCDAADVLKCDAADVLQCGVADVLQCDAADVLQCNAADVF